MSPTERLVQALKDHEGWRAFVYDDATGQPIVPGSVVQGHPTIGFGWALDVTPMTKTLGEVVLRETLSEKIFELTHRLPWSLDLDEVRRNVLYELAYNLGVEGLLRFHRTLDALRSRRYQDAGEHLLRSQWATQVSPERRDRLHGMLVTGLWPTA